MKIKTTADQIADYIRNAMFEGRYLPGDRMKETEIASWLTVSRTPVREAFHKLVAEGLLEFLPNKGAMVPMIDDHDIDEILELRLLIEMHCIRKFIRNATDSNFEEMESIIRKMDYALSTNNIPNYLLFSLDYHDYIVQKCQNQRMYFFFKAIRNTMRIAQSFLGQSDTFHKHSMEEHLKILQLLKNRSPECENVLRQHIVDVCNRMRERMHILYQSEASLLKNDSG